MLTDATEIATMISATNVAVVVTNRETAEKGASQDLPIPEAAQSLMTQETEEVEEGTETTVEAAEEVQREDIIAAEEPHPAEAIAEEMREATLQVAITRDVIEETLEDPKDQGLVLDPDLQEESLTAPKEDIQDQEAWSVIRG